jgi:hypothetical protein
VGADQDQKANEQHGARRYLADYFRHPHLPSLEFPTNAGIERPNAGQIIPQPI